jgi:copper(I)-binding protein
MGRRAWSVVASMLLMASLGRAQAGPTASDAWVAEPAAGATVTDAYAVVENPSMYEVFVVSVTSDAAGSAEIVDGPADAARTMRELSVPAYGRAELKPGAVRIRLKDLKKTLTAGDTIALTLTTDGGANIKVSATVRKNEG